MIRLEEGAARHVRVIGSLQGPALQLLSDVVSRGPLVLDLSEVNHADESAVRLLAELPPERCTLVSCPRWLALWLERVRRAASDRHRGDDTASDGRLPEGELEGRQGGSRDRGR